MEVTDKLEYFLGQEAIWTTQSIEDEYEGKWDKKTNKQQRTKRNSNTIVHYSGQEAPRSTKKTKKTSSNKSDSLALATDSLAMVLEFLAAGSKLIHELATPLKESIALLLDLGNVAMTYGCDQYLDDIKSRLTHALDIQ